MKVIALTFLAYARAADHVHSSGKKLREFATAHKDDALYLFSTKGRRNYCDPHYEGEVYLVFGKETKGLPEELLLSRPENTVRIPMRNSLRSLNLSNSAAIAVYEVLRQNAFEGLCEQGELTRYSWDAPDTQTVCERYKEL